MIAFPCPKCRATLKAPEEKAGARTKCPQCGCPVHVPGRSESLATPIPLPDVPQPAWPGYSFRTLALVASAALAVGLTVGGVVGHSLGDKGKTTGEQVTKGDKDKDATPRQHEPQGKGKERSGDGKQARPESVLPQTTNVHYQGRTAAEWGPELFDADYETAHRAALSLNQIGAESLRFFYEGMSSKSDLTRYFSVNMLPYQDAAQYESVFLPKILELLRDKSGGVRRFAGVALVGCNFKKGLPALRQARDAETDKELQPILARYVEDLEKK